MPDILVRIARTKLRQKQDGKSTIHRASELKPHMTLAVERDLTVDCFVKSMFVQENAIGVLVSFLSLHELHNPKIRQAPGRRSN